MYRDLVIIGNGQMAEFFCSQFTQWTSYRVVGFAADRAFIKAETLLGLPVVPLEEVESHFPPGSAHAFVSIGPVKNNAIRSAKFDEVQARGYCFANLISPHAVISRDATIGGNVCVGHMSVVSSLCKIDDNVYIGPTCVVGHHGQVHRHAFLAGHTILAGSVVIGERAFIGVGATVRDNVIVGAGSVIGAGATILGDVEPNAVYVSERPKKLPVTADQVDL